MKIALKALVTPVIALMGFYLGCLTYQLAAHGLYYLVALTTVVLHIFGMDFLVLQALIHWLDIARSHEISMLSAGVVAACSLAGLTLVLLDLQKNRGPTLLLLTIVLLMFVSGVAADLTWSVTPLSDLLSRDAVYNAKGTPVEHRLAVENIMHLEDRLSGVTAEVEGVLDYSPRMNRFMLRSPAQPRDYVKVIFFKHQRTIFSISRTDEKPRYYEAVRPFIGQRVRILGKCVNGQIDADVADIRTIAEFRNSGDTPNAVKPM